MESRSRFQASKIGLSPAHTCGFPMTRSKVVALLLILVCASVVSYVAFVLSLFVFHFLLVHREDCDTCL